MVELRCNCCEHLKDGYCEKLHEDLPNGFAKLFYGGANGIYEGTLTYPSKCGIEKQKKAQPLNNERLETYVQTFEVIPARIHTQK